MRALFVSVALAALVVCAAQADPPLTVRDAWISESPPGTAVAAGYLEIRNDGAQAAILIGVTSPAFDRVEMHLSEFRGGTAAMHLQDAIEIPAGATRRLAPGGYHLMLFGQPPLPRAGESVGLVLHFADGTRIDLDAPVRRLP